MTSRESEVKDHPGGTGGERKRSYKSKIMGTRLRDTGKREGEIFRDSTGGKSDVEQQE